jgi:hypothetical protein
MQRTGNGQAQVGYSVTGRSGDRVMLCAVCTVHIETRSTSFLVEPQNHGRRFSGLCLKTDSSGLMICALKSPRRFLGLSLKTKRASVYRLRHKTDGWRLMRDTHRDLTAYVGVKQVWLGFFSLSQDWRRRDDEWCT